MSDDPGKPSRPSPRRDPDPPYRVYRSERPDRSASEKSASEERPYTLYRSTPKGLRDRMRGDQEAAEDAERRGLRRGSRRERPEDPLRDPKAPWYRREITPWRVVRWVVGIIVCWVVLSLVLFFISAQKHSGDLPAGAKAALSGGGPILTSANTVLILGLDNRPTTGVGSKEGGLTSADTSEKDARTDTIMLWRIGGGTSRRLSIPRDTLVNIPGYGESKINAAWSYGGPKLALRVIENFTGVKVNHMIVVDLGNFPKFIDDVGGVNVKTGHVCSEISGGKADGGFTLNLKPGTHHLDGEQALILARTRDNSCNLAYDDLNREAAQQQIVNSIKSQLTSVHTFFHLPWVAWDAPGVVQTDMGGLSLLQLFVASEIGGTPKTGLLKESSGTYAGQDVLVPSPTNVHHAVQRLLTGR